MVEYQEQDALPSSSSSTVTSDLVYCIYFFLHANLLYQVATVSIHETNKSCRCAYLAINNLFRVCSCFRGVAIAYVLLCYIHNGITHQKKQCSVCFSHVEISQCTA